MALTLAEAAKLSNDILLTGVSEPGGDAHIDNFLMAPRSNLQDLEAAIVQLKAKALQQKFEDTFVNGDTSVDAKSFDGVDKLCTGGRAISTGTTGAPLRPAHV